MLERLSRGARNILAFKVIGKITKGDYVSLAAEIEALMQRETSIRLLFDLEAFEGEESKAPGVQIGFRGDYRTEIAKMAIVGEMKWQGWLPAFVDLNRYDRETWFFLVDEREAAWEWLRT